MMLAVRSHANAKLIQLARCKFKVFLLGEICWYSSDTNLLSAEKIFEYVKDLFYGSHSLFYGSHLAPAVNFVIFIAQRPSANIALLRGRAKFRRTLSNSPKC